MARSRRDRPRPSRPSPEVSRRAPKPLAAGPVLAPWVVRRVAAHGEAPVVAVALAIGISPAQVAQARELIAEGY